LGDVVPIDVLAPPNAGTSNQKHSERYRNASVPLVPHPTSVEHPLLYVPRGTESSCCLTRRVPRIMVALSLGAVRSCPTIQLR
jgi:hypothetical protein